MRSKRMASGQRFRIRNIDGGHDASRMQRGEQGLGVDDGSARGIDQQCSLFHQGEFPVADHAAWSRW